MPRSRGTREAEGADRSARVRPAERNDHDRRAPAQAAPQGRRARRGLRLRGPARPVQPVAQVPAHRARTGAAPSGPPRRAAHCGAFPPARACSARRSSAPTARSTSARPIARSTRCRRRHAALDAPDRRDHRLGRAARRPRPRLLRLRRRPPPRARRRAPATSVWTFAADAPRPAARSSTGSRATSRSAPTARSTCPTTTSSSTPSIATTAATTLALPTCRTRRGRSPAVDVGHRARSSSATTTLLPILGANTFAVRRRPARTSGSTARRTAPSRRSPLLTADGERDRRRLRRLRARATTPTSGTQLLDVRDARSHLRERRRSLPDGTIVQPSADGTRLRARPRRPARSAGRSTRSSPSARSPAIDADGNVYVGSGDGRLFVLDPDGRCAGRCCSSTRPQRSQRVARARHRRDLPRRRERRDVQRPVRLLPATRGGDRRAAPRRRRGPARRRRVALL